MHHEHGHVTYSEHDLASAAEKIVLKSVGIDIGSTTSHLMFSTITLRRRGWELSSQYLVVGREVNYESDIMLTPYSSGTTIAVEPLSSFISEAYNKAGVESKNIDTGAVITTGEANRKENAEAIANLFSKEAGKFICVTVGPKLEANLGAYGSGAVEKSGEERSTIMNVDIGGGTSKVAIVRDGQVIDTAVISVGARLIILDESKRIVHIEEPGRTVIANAGLCVNTGDQLAAKQEYKIIKVLADCLFEVVNRSKLSPLSKKLMETPPLSFAGQIDEIMFAGGVSEYIYGHEDKDYGDLGKSLAEEIRRRVSLPEFGLPLGRSIERIRATVIGASQYTVQVSGSTIFISNNEILPLRNLPVLTPEIKGSKITPQTIKSAIEESLQGTDLNLEEKMVAFAVHWPLGFSYDLIKSLAQGLVSALSKAIERKIPIILIFDADIGKLVGTMLLHELAIECEVVSIDGIKLQDFEYVDVGEELPNVQAVPVVIKSLIFGPRMSTLK